MSDLEVARWRRFGNDRLYVNTADGQRVGWLDLLTGERTLERDDLRDAFERALAEHAPAAPGATAAPNAAAVPDAAAAPGAAAAIAEPYTIRVHRRDLAQNKPGQAAAEQAVAHRRAAPVATTVARVLGMHTDERAWRIGAAGERKVAAELARLPDGWVALHALPVGDRGADIDHFVVGPGGVFTVNAKHHPDSNVWVGGNTVMVDGHRQPYVRNARHEAVRAARLLSAVLGWPLAVTGVVAVVGAKGGFTVKNQPDDVRVLARTQLAAWLTGLPATRSATDVAAVVKAARRSDTWQPADAR